MNASQRLTIRTRLTVPLGEPRGWNSHSLGEQSSRAIVAQDAHYKQDCAKSGKHTLTDSNMSRFSAAYDAPLAMKRCSFTPAAETCPTLSRTGATYPKCEGGKGRPALTPHDGRRGRFGLRVVSD